ncbi:MAG: PKD domain-containing protein [bacterium]|nr:PKD domain-containing protein [bacterium]
MRIVLALGAAIAIPAYGVSGPANIQEYPGAWCRYGSLPVPDDLASPFSSHETLNYTLAVFYVLPTDVPYDENAYQRVIQATMHVRAWYQCATGGMTWDLEYPEVVDVYYADQTREYYVENGSWWGSLLGEMSSKGLPIWAPGIATVLWVHGAGWWAGAAWGCEGNCGIALLGIELFPELNNPEYSDGECPGGVGVAAWPCTPEGAYAHEIGHILQLPHPSDPYGNHSIMATHWNFPDHAPLSDSPWGFLTTELQSICSNQFMCEGVGLFQHYPDCDVVNLPPAGSQPDANFSVSIEHQTATFTNSSNDNVRNYWTFGDGNVGFELNPVYSYTQVGDYEVSLRVSNSSAMMDCHQSMVAIQTVVPTITPTGTPTPTPTATATYTPTPSPTPSPTPTETPTSIPTPTLTPSPTITPTSFPSVELVVSGEAFSPGDRITVGVRAAIPIWAAFDAYIMADTPAGIFSIMLDGRIVSGIRPAARDVKRLDAPFEMTVLRELPCPASIRGTTTLYLVTTSAGRLPTVGRLEDLRFDTPDLITIDRKAIAVRAAGSAAAASPRSRIDTCLKGTVVRQQCPV